jgi:NADH:ubiquinone oxidoreductase subunit 6 (subunit J)
MTMNRKALLIGIVIAAVVLVMLSAAVLSGDFGALNDNGPSKTPFVPEESGLSDESLPFVLFEGYGPVLLVLAILMFGAIIGGAYIAKEDDEDDTD